VAERSRAHLALGTALRELRTARGLSQERLAQNSGMDRTYVGGIERGERNPAYANVRRLAAALEVPASELLARAEQIEAGYGD
jgi:transcriptional regulator with XRE-family HTH domain